MTASCTRPVAATTLVGYWLGELEALQEGLVDEHLLGCAECAQNLARLVELAGAIRTLVGHGAVQAVASGAFVERLAASGLRLREYRVQPGGSVHCTVAPDDDVMVARLQAPLADVEQLDAVLLDAEHGRQQRLRDIPFDRLAGEVVLTPQIGPLRSLGTATARIRLVARDHEQERVIGEYTFLHAPWPGAQRPAR